MSIPARWTLASQHAIDAIVPGNFRQPPTTQEHISPINRPREFEGPIPASHIWHKRLQHQQLHATFAGPCSPTMYLPTPPVGTDLLLDAPSCQPLSDLRRKSPTAGTPSPQYATHLASHPYLRPANVR